MVDFSPRVAQRVLARGKARRAIARCHQQQGTTMHPRPDRVRAVARERLATPALEEGCGMARRGLELGNDFRRYMNVLGGGPKGLLRRRRRRRAVIRIGNCGNARKDSARHVLQIKVEKKKAAKF
jgi:hypothetical protein